MRVLPTALVLGLLSGVLTTSLFLGLLFTVVFFGYGMAVRHLPAPDDAKLLGR